MVLLQNDPFVTGGAGSARDVPYRRMSRTAYLSAAGLRMRGRRSQQDLHRLRRLKRRGAGCGGGSANAFRDMGAFSFGRRGDGEEASRETVHTCPYHPRPRRKRGTPASPAARASRNRACALSSASTTQSTSRVRSVAVALVEHDVFAGHLNIGVHLGDAPPARPPPCSRRWSARLRAAAG